MTEPQLWTCPKCRRVKFEWPYTYVECGVRCEAPALFEPAFTPAELLELHADRHRYD